MSMNSDPVMTIELGLEEMVVNIMCACAPQVGCIPEDVGNIRKAGIATGRQTRRQRKHSQCAGNGRVVRGAGNTGG